MRVRLRITGRVQGVGFRWFVREHARRLGLAGWVRNEPDGAVVLEVEGDPEAVAHLHMMVSRGPEAAAVGSVQELAASAEPLTPPFAVLR